jgi:hypothetical protein
MDSPVRIPPDTGVSLDGPSDHPVDPAGPPPRPVRRSFPAAYRARSSPSTRPPRLGTRCGVVLLDGRCESQIPEWSFAQYTVTTEPADSHSPRSPASAGDGLHATRWRQPVRWMRTGLQVDNQRLRRDLAKSHYGPLLPLGRIGPGGGCCTLISFVFPHLMHSWCCSFKNSGLSSATIANRCRPIRHCKFRPDAMNSPIQQPWACKALLSLDPPMRCEC